MIELISRISKGSKMDQIYIPKERLPGFELGAFVLIKPVLQKAKHTPYYYNTSYLEPVKNIIIEEILDYFEQYDNTIITGSFLERGFDFEDLDVILITDKKTDDKGIEKYFNAKFGFNIHIIAMDFKVLLKGLSTDPLFKMMLSKFVSKKRVVFKTSDKINYKLLDLHLLKSKALMDNFDFLTGREKYRMTRNLFAILLFMDNKKINKESIDGEINGYFGKNAAKELKENLAGRDFLKKYRNLYEKLFKRIMNGIENGSKQE